MMKLVLLGIIMAILHHKTFTLQSQWKVYSHSFVEMARKGFWSFDRIGKWRYGFDDYVLVAWPSDLNIENKKLIGKHFEMESCNDWPRMLYPNGREWFHWPLMEIVERAEKIEAR